MHPTFNTLTLCTFCLHHPHPSKKYKMPKHKNPTRALAARAWRLLRLAFNRLKSLCTDHHRRHSYRLHYGEHELSFDETPIFRFTRKHRHPFRSCADPRLDSLYDEEEDDDTGCDLSLSKEEREMDRGDEGEIDARAEEFISRFYGEIKLQRERSWLRYNEMLYTGMS